MQVVRDLSEFSELLHASAVTIGSFDGIHLAHQELFKRVVRSAKELGGSSVAVTFDPHPAHVLAPDRAPKILTPLALKTDLIADEKIDILLILPFNTELATLTPSEFVHLILVKKLNAAMVHVGSNFRFGHERSGDTDLLSDLGRREGFRVETLPMMKIRGHQISSSQIRQELARGHVEIAGRMLGRPYAVRGPIARGEGVGHRRTVPTLNLGPVDQQLPKNGVYITRTRVGDVLYDSVTNVGHKPTFGYHRITVESFLLNFRGEIQAEEMEVNFLHRLRDEIQFPSAEALKEQILQDVQRSLKFFRLLKSLGRGVSGPGCSTPART